MTCLVDWPSDVDREDDGDSDVENDDERDAEDNDERYALINEREKKEKQDITRSVIKPIDARRYF